MISVGLCLLTNDANAVQRILDAYGQYFDKLFITVGDKNKSEFYKIQKLVRPDDKVNFFKWTGNFADARNANLEMVDTDTWFWIDSDDSILEPGNIRQLITLLEEEKADAIFLPYEYGFNEQGELIALHWRERLIRTSSDFHWKGEVHETCYAEGGPVLLKDESVVIRHKHKSHEEVLESVWRNQKILEKAVQVKNPDPRNLYYLGRTYFMNHRYADCARTLLEYTQVSGWDEQKYDAWMKIGDALIQMDEHEKALSACLEAMKLKPEWPDAYLKMGDHYLALGQLKDAVEWLKNGLNKEVPQTLEIVDPTVYTYKPLVSMALTYFRMANVYEAKKWIDKAAKFEPKNQLYNSVYKEITNAFFEEETVRFAKRLGQLVEKNGNIKSYVDGLPAWIRNDMRLRWLRIQAYPAVTWPKNSIAIYCGEQWEEWGPEFLKKKGAGGSEEAIIYLSEELQKIGWKVTVYNQRVDEFESPAGVKWLPWELFNPEDTFDVFVAWRSPRMTQKLKIKARVRAVDLHDTPIGHQAMTEGALENLDKIFLKGDYQWKMSETPIPKDKAVIVSNGIVPEQFNSKVERDPHKVMFGSSADRGLDLLVREIWPKVLEKVPDAQLVWAYGWDSYDGMHKGNPEQMRWKWELKRDMFNAGVTELGRLTHQELAEEMASCGVWAYPTSFPEINCITAIKMQAAGVQPITTGYAALQETVLKKEESVELIHTKPDEIQKFTDRLIYALQHPLDDATRTDVAKIVKHKYAWSQIAKQWDAALKEQ
jgi:tetratricopeptide (TPR) repeat protein